MYLNFTEFKTRVNDIIEIKEHLEDFTSIVCAKYVADRVHLPDGQLDDPEGYYSTNIKLSLNEYAAVFVENLNIDRNLMLDHIRIFWMIRYFTAYGLGTAQEYNRVRFSQKWGSVDTMVGAGIYLPDETHSFLNKYKDEFFNALSLLADICQY